MAKRSDESRAGGTATAARTVSRATCHHHWLIEPPNGPTSRGRCKQCGHTRTFPNSSEDSIWDGAEGRSRWNDMGLSRRRRNRDEEPVVEENVVAV